MAGVGETLQSNSSSSDLRELRGARARVPYLFLALSCDQPLAPPARFRLDTIREVQVGRGLLVSAEPISEGAEPGLRIAVPDGHVSSRHARLHRGSEGWVVEDLGSRNGTLLDGEAIKKHVLADGDLLEIGHTFFVFRDIPAQIDETGVKGASDRSAAPDPVLATMLPELETEFERARRVADSLLEVIVQGESGTGKELAARAIHALSRRPGPFIAVNCGALSPSLLESELFGYRRGAFSGATSDRPGLVRSADRGTLLLDEIGDMPLAAQAALLRVLQEREVLPVGDSRPVKVDVRIVAASHRDLDEAVVRGSFRADLLARLRGFTLRLPPLRERLVDLGLLTGALLRRLDPQGGVARSFKPAAARALFRHGWPLNVRELEKALGVAVVLSNGGPIELEHLPEHVRAPRVSAAPAAPPPAPAGVAPSGQPRRPGQRPDAPLSPAEQRHREELIALLRRHEGSVSAVARVLGKGRTQIQRWLKRYALDLGDYRP